MTFILNHLLNSNNELEYMTYPVFQRQMQLNKRLPLLISPGVEQDTSTGFFKLSGEIRNLIYFYLLNTTSTHDILYNDTGAGAYACKRSDGSITQPGRRDPAFNILQTCRQIYKEARPLLENNSSAYLPIIDRFHYGSLVRVLDNQKALFPGPVNATYAAALASFWTVKICLHYHAFPAPKAPFEILARLELVLQQFTEASPSFANPQFRKRQATVHFSNFFSLWFPYPCYALLERAARVYAPADMVYLMGQDQNTEWDVRLYQNVRRVEKGWFFRTHSWVGVRTFTEMVEMAKKFDNVRVTVEIGGELDLAEVDMLEGVVYTKEVTELSPQW
ncbi:hypothetical protein P280DRAFT_263118 [Massarina eburnea CBS 473.64]|uniref:Uncharacterized protein n=1 Tax=Massarina eburnea CBS 473.64 TaxID=1395130 RepID=A0A6A6S3Z4_9PLEO|nr:hypothetical protein P280DRAFT_263118 [Massarina eburnea CBS 473.64]